jgi:hypothetical protein
MRPTASRALVLAMAGLVVSIGIMGCGAPSGDLPPSGSSAVDVPASDLTAYDRCMLDSGFRIVKRAEPGSSGYQVSSVRGWETGPGMTPEQALQAGLECRQKYAPYVRKTEVEIREIYARWVAERECLIGLGYDIVEPPTVERFVADWATGPWMPIDGIDERTWSDADFKVAKDKCGLEMVDRE